MHRLFVALDLPAPVTDEIAAICHGLNGMRWVSPDNLHLTLRFIGEVPPSVTLEIEEALAEIDAAAFSFALVGIGHFESAGRPRAVWLGVEADPGLAELR
ncbi:MAG: RNA 2',3'-cyclic phosphodiesterase, partial [Pseudomonadota bacterium]|nr:RNA 2',3'-cyclic phosphodiesterase [Pseudomonadota bacterium]